MPEGRDGHESNIQDVGETRWRQAGSSCIGKEAALKARCINIKSERDSR